MGKNISTLFEIYFNPDIGYMKYLSLKVKRKSINYSQTKSHELCMQRVYRYYIRFYSINFVLKVLERKFWNMKMLMVYFKEERSQELLTVKVVKSEKSK